MENVIALDGYTVQLDKGEASIIIDYNNLSKKVVRIISLFPNHRTMIGKDIHNILSLLLSAGWVEVGRESWQCIYATAVPKETVERNQ